MVSITQPGLQHRSLSLSWLFGWLFSPALWALAVLLVVWEASVILFSVKAFILPAPTAIAAEIVNHADRLAYHGWITLSEVLLGFLLSIAIGLPLAILIVYSHMIERAIYPLIVATQTIPKIAIAPVMLTWFGYGMAPKVVIVMLLSFFPIVINSVMGFRSVSPEMIYLSRSMNATGWQTFWKIRFPQALPSIFGGLKLATALSVIGATVAEFVGADKGLGYLIVVSSGSFDIARQFAAIVVLSFLGIMFFSAIQLLERLTVPWKSPELDRAATGR